MKFIPHPYQVRTLGMLRQSIGSGKRAPLVVSPTGSGKTVMLGMAAAGHLEKRPDGRVVGVVHTDELVTQMADTLRVRFGLEVGSRGLGAAARVQVRTVQQILASGEAPDATLAFFDEAHHYASAAEEWARVREAYKAIPIVGFTATPERGDGAALEGAFDDLIVACQISELQAMWHADPSRTSGLVPLKILDPGKKIRAKSIATSPYEAYRRHALGQLAIVFAPHLKAANDFADEFNGAGIRAAVVTGKTPKDERRAMLAAWSLGKIRVMCNVKVLTEGFDLPALSCGILAGNVGSAGGLIQRAGRLLRPHPGKYAALLIDLVGCTLAEEHGRPDADREFSLEGLGIRQLGQNPEIRFCKVCGAVLGPNGCPDCAAGELETPRSLGLDLKPWQGKIRQEKLEQRIDRLANRIGEARRKGHKDAAVRFWYRACYGMFPRRELWTAALARLESLGAS
jgi:superfamily II DNA or RNA helicase